MDDLSVPLAGDVFKPPVCWTVLPALIRQRLASGGIAVFNLIPPPDGSFGQQVERIARLFPMAHRIDLDEFQNCILVAGERLPSARALGRRLRASLQRLRSRQADRIHLRSFRTAR